MQVVGVTGTNGKTSTTWFLRSLWSGLGTRVAVLGNGGWRLGARAGPAPVLAAGGVSFLRFCQEREEEGAQALVFEAWSYPLSRGCYDGAMAAGALYTSFDRDHLDRHGTLEAYWAAKLRLVERVLRHGGWVLGAPLGGREGSLAEACAARGHRLEFVGEGRATRLMEARPAPAGLEAEVLLEGERHRLHLPLYAPVQVYSLLLAWLWLVRSGAERRVLLPLLEAVEVPPGRMERVVAWRGCEAFVDHGHTPGALREALRALRARTRGRLHVVLGCGGERDAGKRPLMGREACAHADTVWLTDDQPRGEEPAAIRAAIAAGAPGAREIAGRARAITLAARALEPGDGLLVAGCGDEPWWDEDSGSWRTDAQVLREVLERPS